MLTIAIIALGVMSATLIYRWGYRQGWNDMREEARWARRHGR